MRTFTTSAVVEADRTMTVQLPPDVLPGPHEIVVVLNGSVPVSVSTPPQTLRFAPHDVAPADPTATYRREDLYDDGRH